MLDELVNTIKGLKARIKEHRDQIQVYEARTRTTLIDPMLYALGWDVSDPSMVTIEPKTDDGWADYALLDDRGRTVVFVEAKRLADSNLHIKQTIGYAISENMQGTSYVRYCAFTNGDVWELYDLTTQKPVLRTSVVSDETAKCALQLLGLWRSSMADRLYSAAVEPVVDSSSQPLPDPPPAPPPVDLPDAVQAAHGTVPPTIPPGWTALNERFTREGKPAPKSIKFPDGSETVIKSWVGVIAQTAVWLHQKGHLTKENCQILASDHAVASRYILSRDGKNANSKNFYNPRRISDGIILELDVGPSESIRRSIRLLEHCGQDPSQVLLQLS